MKEISSYEERLEELQDIADAVEVLKHQKEFIPWEKVKKDLGLP